MSRSAEDDRPEDIERCLSCERDRCTNCLHYVYHGAENDRRMRTLDAGLFAELYNAGRTPTEMAERLGTGDNTIRRRMQRAGLDAVNRRMVTAEELREMKGFR